MAVTKNTADLLAQAVSTLPDNTTQLISPQDAREMSENIAQSSYNKVTDSALVGLKEHSVIPTYESGQGCVSGGKVYISNKVTGPGVFAAADWDIYLDLSAADKLKLDYLTVTSGADLDQMQTDIAALDGARINKGTFDQALGVFPGGGTAQDGWTWIAVGVTTTIDGVEINPNDAIVSILDNASTTVFAGNWHLQDNTDKVISVNGNTGVVVLNKTDVGLSNVPNTDFTTAVGLNTVKVSADGLVTTHSDVDSSTLANKKNNLAGTTAPVAGDDTGDGYEVGSIWLDTTNDKGYICLDSTAAAAVWVEITVEGENISTTDLIFAAHRSHNLNGFILAFTGGTVNLPTTNISGVTTLTTSSGVSNSLVIKNGVTNQVQLFHFTGFGGYMRLLNAGGSVGWEMTGGGSTPNYMNTPNRFGFGTSAPNALVNINSTTTGGTAIGLTVTNTGVTKANLFYLNGFGGYMILKNDSGGNGFELAAQGTPGYINTGQPFGIGTAAPQAGTRLHVVGDTILDGSLKLPSIPTYADEAAAVIGGLATDSIYKTATGELRIKL